MGSCGELESGRKLSEELAVPVVMGVGWKEQEKKAWRCFNQSVAQNSDPLE